MSTNFESLSSASGFTATPPRLAPQFREQLRRVSLLSGMSDDELEWFSSCTPQSFPAGSTLIARGGTSNSLWLLLEGSVAIRDVTPEGGEVPVWTLPVGSTFGEVALLASIASPWSYNTAEPSILLRLDEATFWRLMNESPAVRQATLRTMAIRLQKTQQQAVHQEKMAALGMLAAGLMHELNNPGAAARRAATQLRDDLVRLQQSSDRIHSEPLAPSQRHCLSELQKRALTTSKPVHLNSLDQSDAEQELADWMEAASIDDAWKLAPALSSIGLTSADMVCAQHEFPPALFGESLAWLEAVVSTNQRLATIEDSLGRVVELVRSVKTYAYEGSGKLHSIDLNDSIQATLVMLGHKLRERGVQVERELAPALPRLNCACTGLNQVWTNLLDNAIDAVPPGGTIRVHTWLEGPETEPDTKANRASSTTPASATTAQAPEKDTTASDAESQHGETYLGVLIADNGSGIPLDAQPRIFDPFYTTKESGVGTGLGLGIVQKIIEQNHGSIYFTSEPGKTEFHIRIPVSA